MFTGQNIIGGCISGSTITVTSGERWSYCPKCGRRLDEGWTYCPGCGTAIQTFGSHWVYPTYPWSPWTQPTYPTITWADACGHAQMEE